MMIKIPFKTPSVNHLYFHRGNIKILTTEARKLRDEISKLISPNSLLEGEKLCIEVYMHENWLLQSGLIARKDILNREKFLVDSIFKALQIDDKYIWEAHFFKVQDEEEYSLIEITPVISMNRDF